MYSINQQNLIKKEKYKAFIETIQQVFSDFFAYLQSYINQKNIYNDWQPLFVKQFQEIVEKYHLFSADNINQLQSNFQQLFTQYFNTIIHEDSNT